MTASPLSEENGAITLSSTKWPCACGRLGNNLFPLVWVTCGSGLLSSDACVEAWQTFHAWKPWRLAAVQLEVHECLFFVPHLCFHICLCLELLKAEGNYDHGPWLQISSGACCRVDVRHWPLDWAGSRCRSPKGFIMIALRVRQVLLVNQTLSGSIVIVSSIFAHALFFFPAKHRWSS